MEIGIDIRHLATASPSGVGLYTIAVIEAMAKLAPTDNFWLFAAGTESTMDRLPEFKSDNIRVVKKNWPNKILSLGLLSGRITLEDLMPVKLDAWWFPNLNIINTKLPYLITAHDLSFKFFPKFLTVKTKSWHKVVAPTKLYTNAKKILAVSQSTKRDLMFSMNLPSDQIAVTPLGYDPITYQPRRQPSDGQFRAAHGINFPYFLSLCTLEPRKNLISVVEGYTTWRQHLKSAPSVSPINGGVFPELTNSRSTPPDMEGPGEAPHLVIAGGVGWKSGALHRAIQSSYFRDQIHLTGYVPEKHKGALYRGASAFIFPSFYEGFGLPVLEAMACGTPVIASFTSSLPEIVGQAGLLVDPYRPSDITQALTLVSDPQTAELLRSRGLEQAKNFSWTKTAQLTLEAVRQMC